MLRAQPKFWLVCMLRQVSMTFIFANFPTWCFQEEDFNVHIAGLPLEHTTTAAGAPATGITNNAPATGSKKGNSGAAAAAAATERTEKVCMGLYVLLYDMCVLVKRGRGLCSQRPFPAVKLYLQQQR